MSRTPIGGSGGYVSQGRKKVKKIIPKEGFARPPPFRRHPAKVFQSLTLRGFDPRILLAALKRSPGSSPGEVKQEWAADRKLDPGLRRDDGITCDGPAPPPQVLLPSRRNGRRWPTGRMRALSPGTTRGERPSSPLSGTFSHRLRRREKGIGGESAAQPATRHPGHLPKGN